MIEHLNNQHVLWPLLLYGAAVILVIGGMLTTAYFLGERHNETATDEVYESGIKATGSARLHFPIHFYLIAMFFVIFDVAAVFVISWAISIREAGWAGYTAILIFIGILGSALLYIWKMGALDFGPDGKKILKAYHERIRNEKRT